ncbi:MAG: glycine/sarcosine/betaine reductase complex component C subunit alpha [Alkaliphilus sp.]
MENKVVKEMISNVFLNIADGIETGQFGKNIKIGITTLGSEHGISNIVNGAEQAAKNAPGYDVILIGPKIDTKLEVVEVTTEDEMHRKMEELLKEKYIDACVTMHYNFPIGVSTVGRVITPGKGKELFVATTTGTSAPGRVEAMVKNAIHGVIAAKATGISSPTVGILNVDGARQVERVLKELDSNGYKINFAEGIRADGGVVMRGNDLLAGTPDVMLQDTLTGNILMKMFSAFTTGGDYEASGYGYGPGIGEGYDNTILILSRASGVPVVAGAIKYAADLVRGNINKVNREEFEAVNKAGLKNILDSLNKDKKKPSKDEEEVVAPPKEIVTGSLAGIDILDLEDAVKELWRKGIYAESGMGCTGAIVMISEANIEKSIKVLKELEYLPKDYTHC